MDARNSLSESGLPLLRMPDSVPRPVVAIGAMVVLAGLDVLGAVMARRWAHGGSAIWFGAGLACFVVLFWVYGSSLRYADLVPVTFGWIAALQVGLLIIGRVGSSAPIPLRSWLAAAAIIALEGYLLASSDTG
jgi:hypothetical protein